MLICLTGISISYIVWALSSNFALFILARFIGGISKGNVSLSMAVIADASSGKGRTKGMALVGIAFSLGFTIGPLIGALFSQLTDKTNVDWFMYPAVFAFLLSIADLLFVAVFFNETLPKEHRSKATVTTLSQATNLISIPKLFKFTAVSALHKTDKDNLKRLGLVYFIYLFLYSGLEFTLTFLTHHTFGYSSMQQGKMFFFIGIIMAIFQGGFVRRVPEHKLKSAAVAGLWLIVPAYGFVALSPIVHIYFLYIGLFLFAVSTAFVVPSLMSLASRYGGVEQKGTVMGVFRSLGALARAVGPVIASIAFWSIGCSLTYLVGGVLLIIPVLMLQFSNV
ncbi:major facilitator superfamily domain-containing protein 10-like [Ctenocephalides felis]|uniref:major facilitator superfamily domain-containing protein 10-like n=1 Tax=Ctenocephalides felis TaxID=7515 RepID=UPI000E6E29B0|nr:major facilitator superfamily domain-containing protein 10-like [Ctenocephalides felis]